MKTSVWCAVNYTVNSSAAGASLLFVGSNARVMAAAGGTRANQPSQAEPAQIVPSIYFIFYFFSSVRTTDGLVLVCRSRLRIKTAAAFRTLFYISIGVEG
ncbi:hypothetical protein PoB_005918200 [Plakobranchus ocellatus]|uniref:Secreted protein n=1 Tax=Plakobranchus ocellatus TaxID=259542 RepID=A0AAV4CLX0_9GAST|nr:hypothetical protein PoB_005918200 [Plakobranchus ocellatus]